MRKLDPKVLQDVVGESGLAKRPTGQSYVFDCPRCGKEDKLYMRKSDGKFICWSCEPRFSGWPEYALAEILHLDLDEVRERLYGDDCRLPFGTPDDLTFPFLEEEVVDPREIPILKRHRGDSIDFPPDFVPIGSLQGKRGADYLAGRGIPTELAVEYRIMYNPSCRRVIFPVYVGDKLYGYQERAIGDVSYFDHKKGKTVSGPEKLTAPGLNRSLLVMFEDRLRGSDHAVICEGPVDALKCHLCGGNIATMGKIVTLDQIRVIRAYGVRKVYLGLDPDAVTETLKLVNSFTDLECFLLRPPRGKEDLGKATLEENYESFKSAPPVDNSLVLGV